MSIGDRLAEERTRLGLSQKALATLLGVSVKAVGRYERGENVPGGEVLAKLAEAGADVLYILTGERAPAPTLSREEAALLDNYRHAPPEGKQALQTMGTALAKQKDEKRHGSA